MKDYKGWKRNLQFKQRKKTEGVVLKKMAAVGRGRIISLEEGRLLKQCEIPVWCWLRLKRQNCLVLEAPMQLVKVGSYSFIEARHILGTAAGKYLRLPVSMQWTMASQSLRCHSSDNIGPWCKAGLKGNIFIPELLQFEIEVRICYASATVAT